LLKNDFIFLTISIPIKMTILSSWLFAKHLQPLLPKNENFSISLKSNTLQIEKSALEIWFYIIFLLTTESFWKTSCFFLFQEIYQFGLTYPDFNFIKLNSISITHKTFLILLIFANIRFSSFIVIYSFINCIIYLMILYKNILQPYFAGVLIILLRCFHFCNAKIYLFKNRIFELIKNKLA